MLIACVDGSKGFPDASNSTFPETKIQFCIVHMVRNSLKFAPWKGYKAVTTDLKRIYQSITEQEVRLELDNFAEKWAVTQFILQPPIIFNADLIASLKISIITYFKLSLFRHLVFRCKCNTAKQRHNNQHFYYLLHNVFLMIISGAHHPNLLLRHYLSEK
ncbi:MAG: transposase [Gammaproteobacteria bacterium]|nr:transposase [Gammaproteobacteria bacterium]